MSGYYGRKLIENTEPAFDFKKLKQVVRAEQFEELDTSESTSDFSKFKLLKPTVTDMPPKSVVNILSTHVTVLELLESLRPFEQEDLAALDLETKGTEAHNPLSYIVGVGLANSTTLLYVPRQDDNCSVWDTLLTWLSGKPIRVPGSPSLSSSGYQGGLIAHNVYFDSAHLQVAVGWLNWKWCTYGLFRQLANEGFGGQKWSLKYAQLALLGWTETNETELDQWLITNEHVAGVYRQELRGEENLTERLAEWELGNLKPNKAEMWRAPHDILGYYCGLDAASTYSLFTEVMAPAIESLSQVAQEIFTDYHNEIFITNVRLLVEQQLSGIIIDTDKLATYREELEGRIVETGQSFVDHPEIAPLINKWDSQILEEHLTKEPVKFKKGKPAPKEPLRYKKNGKESVSWAVWTQRYKEWEMKTPEESPRWTAWNKKREALQSTVQFNINSSLQKKWLFYDELNYPVILKTPKGEPAVDKRALQGFGEPGALLKLQNDLNKESQYIDACFKRVQNGILHPQFRVPGTLTCRLAGAGGLNVQQVPKSRGYLECWIPRPGMIWIDCDVTSLEQVVLAELSRDPTLFKLYGPGAKPNDVYLFNGAGLPGIGREIRSAGYDPDNPTPEGISSAKSVAKKARTASKIITLGSSYGMGPTKLQQTLTLQGIKVSKQEAYDMWEGYWELYKGVKEYESRLVTEWKARGGWVYNGIGRPVCCDSDYIKDIVNRVVQSTGHDILMIINYHISRLLVEREIKVNGILWDFHDETLLECREEDLEDIKVIFKEAYDLTNQELRGSIPIKGDIQVCKTFADAKFE